MLVPKARATRRQVDQFMTILGYFPPDASNKLSVVGAELDGEHTLRKNTECDQVYFVLQGSGSADLDGRTEDLQQGDALLILAGQTHAIRGKMDLLIINGPAYQPEQTEILA